MDPFPGNNQDPQSLHKYLYCHANPVNGIDPSGKYVFFGDVTVGMGIRATIFGIMLIVLAALSLQFFHLLGTNVLRQPYLNYIKNSAARSRLSPKLVAAIIATEQKWIGWRDALGDVPGAYSGRNTSIGLGQIRISTAIKHNLVDTTDKSEVIKRLQDPEKNIEATARYIRILADMGAESKFDISEIDFLKQYKLHGDEWDYENPLTVIIIGSEYNSTPWDGSYTMWWGQEVYKKYKEIDNSGLF